MNLNTYILKRNGVPAGSSNSLRNNLYRSFGAKNFATFWNYWNPVFGYYLGYYIFKPLKKVVPAALALLGTFICCGGIHDIVTILYRGYTSWFFTLWFIVMGILVLGTQFLKHDFSNYSWGIRATINTLLLAGSFGIVVIFSKVVDVTMVVF
ncbi:hypothetical protein ACG2LH_05650 [Zhouia sp. PK063]|uniref:hypothetical protein n=1 Tax=Zhouia sp. PK063 TaxID=3373602 RepID=UPI0037A15F35